MMKRIKPAKAAALLMLASVSLVLTACGGDSDSGSGSSDQSANPTPATPVATPATPPATANRQVTGVLLAPETVATTSVRAAPTLMAKGDVIAQATDPSCTSVPAGYTPITNTAVAFTDAAGSLVNASAVTDICGRFDAANVPAEAVNVRFAASAGYQELNVPIATLIDRNGDGAVDPVSTLPTGATLELAGAGLFSGRLTFIVRDSVTGKAVLGIPSSAIAVNGPSGPVPLADFTYSAAATGSATISLVLDASNSMAAAAATGSTLSRYQVTAAAAKLFVDRIDTTDQVGTVVFDDTANFLDTTFFGTTWTGRIVDAAGQVVPLGLPATGFSSDKVVLNRLIDFYNPRSDSWRLATAPVRFLGRAYPWGGSTAIWDATSLGLDRVVAQPGRQFVLAMTDGEDNASRTTVAALTAKAVAAKVPVFTVGIGSVSSPNTTNMRNLSVATGGSFTLVNDGDVQTRLAGAFDSIRTGIRFQYSGTLSGVAAGSSVRVALDHAGLRAETAVIAN